MITAHCASRKHRQAMNHLITPASSAEFLSALADGELRSEELPDALTACVHSDEAALASWASYHLIGDVLRAPAAARVQSADSHFLHRLNQRLALESAPAPAKTPVQAGPDTSLPVDAPAPLRAAASNDDSFGWKLVAGLASMAAVSAIAWNAFGLSRPSPAPQIAQGSDAAQIIVASPQGPVVRDKRLDELLAAHRQLGGGTALQVPLGFLRNAAFETPPDGRR